MVRNDAGGEEAERNVAKEVCKIMSLTVRFSAARISDLLSLEMVSFTLCTQAPCSKVLPLRIFSRGSPLADL